MRRGTHLTYLLVYTGNPNPNPNPNPSLILGLHRIAGAKADDIKEALDNTLDFYDCAHKLAAVGVDGCSVMTGVRNGVVQKIRDKISHIIGIHCMAHRLALATKHSANENPYMRNRFFPGMEKLVFYYCHSTQRVNSLQRCQEQSGVRPLRILGFNKTRWLSRGNTTNTIVARVPEILDDLVLGIARGGETKTCASGLYKRFRERSFLSTLCMFADIIMVIDRLCRILQLKDANLEMIDKVNACIESLEDLVENDGLHLTLLPQLISKVSKKHEIIEPRASRLGSGVPQHDTTRKAYIRSLVNNLKSRFPNNDVLVAFKTLFIPSNYINMPEDDLKVHGNKELNTLLAHYSEVDIESVLIDYSSGDEDETPRLIKSSLVDFKQTKSEWGVVKRLIHKEANKLYTEKRAKLAKFLQTPPEPSRSDDDNSESENDSGDEQEYDINLEDDTPFETLRKAKLADKLAKKKAPSTHVTLYELVAAVLNDQTWTCFPGICTMMSIAVLIPMVTVHCERGFSCMKRIKTRLRNRMADSMLSNLMNIKLEGPDLEDDEDLPLRAFIHWLQQKNRRLFTQNNFPSTVASTARTVTTDVDGETYQIVEFY